MAYDLSLVSSSPPECRVGCPVCFHPSCWGFHFAWIKLMLFKAVYINMDQHNVQWLFYWVWHMGVVKGSALQWVVACGCGQRFCNGGSLYLDYWIMFVD